MEPSLREGFLVAITRARADGTQESLDMPDAMDVGDGHPTRPVPGSSPRLHAQGGAEQVYNPLSRHTPLMGATLEGLGSTSTAGQTSLNHARFSGAGLMLTFENSVPSASHSRLEVPVRKTWRAEEGPELGGACGAHLVASTAHVLAAAAQAPPPAALRTRAQPVAAAPMVLQRRVSSLGHRVKVWEDGSDDDFANPPAPRACEHPPPLAPASSDANGSSTPSHDDGVEHPTRTAPCPSGARSAPKAKRKRHTDATAASQPQPHAASSIAPRITPCAAVAVRGNKRGHASDDDFTSAPPPCSDGAASSTAASADSFRPRAVIASAADAADAAGAPGRAAEAAAVEAAADEAAGADEAAAAAEAAADDAAGAEAAAADAAADRALAWRYSPDTLAAIHTVGLRGSRSDAEAFADALVRHFQKCVGPIVVKGASSTCGCTKSERTPPPCHVMLSAAFKTILEASAYAFAFPPTIGVASTGVAGGATHVIALLTATGEAVTTAGTKLCKGGKTIGRGGLVGWQLRQTPLLAWHLPPAAPGTGTGTGAAAAAAGDAGRRRCRRRRCRRRRSPPMSTTPMSTTGPTTARTTAERTRRRRSSKCGRRRTSRGC